MKLFTWEYGCRVITIKYYTPKEIEGWLLNWGQSRTSSAGDSKGKDKYVIDIIYFTILGLELEIFKYTYY